MTNMPANFQLLPSTTTLLMGWDAPTDDTTRYELSRNAFLYYSFNAHHPDATRFGDDLPYSEVETTWTYSLVAFDAAGNASEPATLEYSFGGSSLPTAPTNLQASVDGNTVVLTWTTSTHKVAYYDVRRDYMTVARVEVGTGTYTDTGVADGQHLYLVVATSSDDLTAASDPLTVTVGSPPQPGDDALTGTEGTFTVQDFSDVLTITKTYTPTIDGSLVMQVTDPAGWLPVFTVTNAAGDEVDDTDGTLTIVWGAGEPMTITITAADGQPTSDVTFTWSYAARASSALNVAIDEPEVSETPGGLEISVFGGQADDTITLSLIGPTSVADFQTAVLDDYGNYESLIVELPALQAGSYDLRIESTQSGAEDASFTATQDALSFDEGTERVADVAPVRDPAQHWRFYDPFDADNTWTFVNNPASWTNVFPPNDFTHNKTTAIDGQPLTWQAAARPWRMEFTGTTFTEDEYLNLVFWSQLRRRFWLIDHRNRAWLMTIEQLDAQPQVKPGYPWLHQYTVKTLVFMQG